LSYMLLVYLHMDWKRYKSDFNKIVTRARKCSKRRNVLHRATATLTWYIVRPLVLQNVRHC